MNNITSPIYRLLSIIPKNWSLFWSGVIQYSIWIRYHLFSVIMLGVIVDTLQTNEQTATIKYIVYYAIGIVILHVFAYFTRNMGRVVINAGYMKLIQREYIPKFVYLDINKCERIGSGKLISIIDKGMRERGNLLSQGLEKFIAIFFTLLYVFYTLQKLGIAYLLVFILLSVCILFLAYKLNQYMILARRKRISASNIYVKHLIRIIHAKAEIMQSWQQDKEMQRLDEPLDSSIEANKNMQPYIHRFFFGSHIIIDIGRIILFFLFAWGYAQSTMSIGLLVNIGAAFVLFDKVLADTLTFYKDVTKNFDVIQTLRDLVDENQPNIRYDFGANFNLQHKDIVVKNVTFAYSDTTVVLENFSLTIKSKQKTALVGPSGGGKSTLVKLIAGYLQPDQGEVIIDKQNLSTTNLLSYYKHVGYLTQEPSVFDGTIRENLEYGMNTLDNSLSSQERAGVRGSSINAIIPLAKCERIYDLPQGLDTEIGERGVRLSGGQKQRLAIAKIMLKNPDIILLDEPTSALDSANEQAVTEALNNLFKNKTVIIIAHRLQTVKHADDIIYIADGKVIERGTHDKLLALGGEYYKMVELQSGF